MNIGIIGIGLIGGSLAKAYRNEGHIVYGFDTDEAILSFARLSGALDGMLDDTSLRICEALFIAINPADTVKYLKKSAPSISGHTLVMDCCGVKRFICKHCFPLADKYGFTFVGGHPMAGSHNAGFKHSRSNLFRGASMILVPPVYDDAALYGRIEELLMPAGFGRLTVTTAEKHDEMIAFSSQMAHIVSNAYIKNPSAKGHKGFSAGSYKDLTRVARLNPDMWAELCMENNDFLIRDLDYFIHSLMQYKNAMAAGDIKALKELLEEGNRLKGELDK